jgi:hypothetical protein
LIDRNGYVRIKILDGSSSSYGWVYNLTFILDLQNYLSLSCDVLAELCSELSVSLVKHQFSFNLHGVYQRLTIFWMYAMYILGYFGKCCPLCNIMKLYFMILLYFSARASCDFRGEDDKPSLIVAQYATKLAQQNIYMDYQKQMKFHWCTAGHYVCHYIYLLPQRSANLALIEVGRSIKQGTH